MIGLVFSTALGKPTGTGSAQAASYAHAATLALSITLASMIAAALLAWRLPPAPATAPTDGVFE